MLYLLIGFIAGWLFSRRGRIVFNWTHCRILGMPWRVALWRTLKSQVTGRLLTGDYRKMEG